jgi:DNA-binding YbaB/EbfC family protein
MRTVQEVQRELALAQTELAETEVTGTAGGGLVTVIMRGDGEVTRVAFDQAAVDQGDAGALSALTFTAIRNATDTMKAIAADKTASIRDRFESYQRDRGVSETGGLVRE